MVHAAAATHTQRHAQRDAQGGALDVTVTGEKHEYGCLRVLVAKPPAYPSVHVGDLVLAINGRRVVTNDDAHVLLSAVVAGRDASVNAASASGSPPPPVVFEILRLHCDNKETLHLVSITPS